MHYLKVSLIYRQTYENSRKLSSHFTFQDVWDGELLPRTQYGLKEAWEIISSAEKMDVAFAVRTNLTFNGRVFQLQYFNCSFSSHNSPNSHKDI